MIEKHLAVSTVESMVGDEVVHLWNIPIEIKAVDVTNIPIANYTPEPNMVVLLSWLTEPQLTLLENDPNVGVFD